MQKLEKVLLTMIFAGVCAILLTPFVIAPVLYSYSFDKTIFFQSIILLILPLWITLISLNSKYRLSFSFLTKSILLFLAVLFLSALFGLDFGKSFWGSDNRMTGIFTFLHFFIFYLILISLFKKETYKKITLIFTLVVSFILSIIGIIEGFEIPFQEFLTGGFRVFSLIGNPIPFAGYLLLHIFISFYLISQYKRKLFKGIFLLIGLFEIFVLYLTFSRGGYIGFVVGIGTVLCLFLINYFSKNKKFVKIFLVIIFTGFILGSFFASQIFSILNIEPGGTIQTRLMLWEVAKKGFLENPILGAGHDNFDLVYGKHYDTKFLNFSYYETWSDRAHNLAFDLLSNSGILGLASYLLIFFSAFWLILKEKVGFKEFVLIGVLVSYFAQNLFSFDSTSALLIFFFLLALVHSEYEKRRNEALPRSEKRIDVNNILTIVACLIISIFVLVFLNIRPAIASYYALSSNVVFGDNYKMSEEYFKKSMDIFSPYRDLARIKFVNNVYSFAINNKIEGEEKNRLVSYAILEVQKSKEKHPNTFSYPFLLGNLYTSNGEYKKAYIEYEEALELSPKRQVVYFQYASAKFLEGDKEGAREILKKAVELDNSVGEVHWRYGLSLIEEDSELAMQEAIEAIEKEYSPYNLNEELKMNEISAFAKIFIDKGEFASLRQFYELLVQFNIEGAEIYAQLAVVYYELGDFENAKTSALKAVEFDPSFEEEAREFINLLNLK